MATHELFYGDLEIGTITDDDMDFPRLSGRYTVTLPADKSDLHQHIHDYIAYSREAWRLAMLDEDADGSQLDAYQAAHESEYIDLIESNDWYVVSNGRKQRILIPNFGMHNEVVWAWDFS